MKRETRWTILLDGKPMTREALEELRPPRQELTAPQRTRWDRALSHQFDVAEELPKSLALPMLVDVRRALPSGHLLRLRPVMAVIEKGL